MIGAVKSQTRTITDYLKQRGISAARLAYEIGISPQFLSDIRARRRQPSLDIAIRIATRCRIPIASLVVRASS